MDVNTTEPCKWKRVETVILCLLLLAPLCTDPWGSVTSTSKALYITIFASLLATAFLFRSFFKCGFLFAPSWADLPWILFLLLGAFSIAWSINAPVHLQRIILLVSVTVPFFLVRIRLTEGNDILPYILILLAVGFLVALIDSWGILWLSPRSDISGEEVEKLQTFKADSILFPHHNIASIYTVILFPLALSAFLYTKSKGVKLFCSACIIVLFTYLVILESRAALVEAGLGLLVITFGLLIRKWTTSRARDMAVFLRKWPVLLSIAGLLLLIFLLPLHKGFSAYAKAGFVEFVKFFDLDFNRAFFRVDLWRKTMAMVSDHFWLGVGFGNFPVVFPAYHKLEILKSHPHSEYFNVLSELGIVGMVFYASFLVLLFKAFLNSLFQGNRRDQVLSLGLGCALLMGGVHGFVEPLMIFEGSALNLLFCSGLLLHLEYKALGTRVFSVGPGKSIRRILLPVFAFMGFLLILSKFCFAFTTSLVLEQAEEAMQKKEYSQAESLYRKALHQSWESHYLHLKLGVACFRQGEEEKILAKDREGGEKSKQARQKHMTKAREKFQEAYEEYLKAEKLFPYYFDIYFKKGVALECLEQHREAVEALTQCLAYNQRYQPAKGERIKILFQLESFDEAFHQLGKYLKSKKPTMFELWKAGDMYERASYHKDRSDRAKLKDLKKSLKCFEKCLKIPGASEKFPKLRFSIKRIKDRVIHLEREANVKS